MDDSNGDLEPEANGNADVGPESREGDKPSTLPHAQAPQETPNLLDQPR